MLWKGTGEYINMDEMARGIATAALTLQSAMLQALVAHGVVSPTQALDIVDLALEVGARPCRSRVRQGQGKARAKASATRLAARKSRFSGCSWRYNLTSSVS